MENKLYYQKILQTIDKLGSNVGVDFLFRDVANPITIFGYVLIYVMAFVVLCNIYSVFYFKDSFMDLAYVLSSFGVVISVTTKTVVAFKMNYYVHEIIAEIKKMLGRMANHREKCNEMRKGLKALEWTFKIITMAYTGSVVLIYFFGSAVSIYKKEKNLVLGFIIPFLDQTKSPGFEINWLCHLVEAYVALMLLIPFDTFYFGHMLIACSHKLTMIHFCRDFDKLASDNEIVDVKDAEKCLEALINEHQSHLRMIRNLSDFHKTHNLCQVISNMTGIILTIFVLVKILWIPGVILFSITVVHLFAYSAIGTIYMICAEKFEKEVYNCKWYLLPPKVQKGLALVLFMSQNPIQPSVGGFTPMDLHTFMKVSGKNEEEILILVKP